MDEKKLRALDFSYLQPNIRRIYKPGSFLSPFRALKILRGLKLKQGDEKDLDTKYFVIRTGEFIKLPRPIKNRKGVRVTYKFTTFEKLLKAKYYDEL